MMSSRMFCTGIVVAPTHSPVPGVATSASFLVVKWMATNVSHNQQAYISVAVHINIQECCGTIQLITCMYMYWLVYPVQCMYSMHVCLEWIIINSFWTTAEQHGSFRIVLSCCWWQRRANKVDTLVVATRKLSCMQTYISTGNLLNSILHFT